MASILSPSLIRFQVTTVITLLVLGGSFERMREQVCRFHTSMACGLC